MCVGIFQAFPFFCYLGNRESVRLILLFLRNKSQPLNSLLQMQYGCTLIVFLMSVESIDSNTCTSLPFQQKRFEKAMEMVGSEFKECVLRHRDVWLPARDIVKEALRTRREVQLLLVVFHTDNWPWKQYTLNQMGPAATCIQFEMFSSFAIHLSFLAYWIQAIVRDVRWRYANKVGIIYKHSKSLDTIVCLCHQLTCPQSLS